jgi:hypothetical protein
LSGVAKCMLASETVPFFRATLMPMMEHISCRYSNVIPHIFTS